MASEYHPITTDEIRLLSILPSVEYSGYVQCSLSHCDRTSAPPYEALSYTWGDLEKRTTILCNGRQLEVTQNCNAALQALRHQSSLQEEASRLKVWIDAICINQKNDVERSAQVAQMGRIFGCAHQTIIYLGELDENCSFIDNLCTWAWDPYTLTCNMMKPGDETDGVALQNLKEMLREERPHWREQWFCNSGRTIQYQAVAGNDYKAKQPPIDIWDMIKHQVDSDAAIESCIAFFNRPWFTRTWVVQEVMVSRHLYVLIGSRKLSWWSLNGFPDTLRALDLAGRETRKRKFYEEQTRNESAFDRSMKLDEAQLQLPQILEMRETLGIIHDKTSIWQDAVQGQAPVRQEYQTGLKLWRLLPMLLTTSRFQCRDPRDKLFAILPLFERPIPTLLTPDYLKSLEEVCANLCWFLIQYDVPEILDLIGVQQNGEALPSWVVDWRRERPESLLDRVRRSMEHNHPRLLGAGFTYGNKRLVVKREGSVLILRGVEVKRHRFSSLLRLYPDLEELERCFIFLGASNVHEMKPFMDGWKLVRAIEWHPYRDGRVVKDLDWSTVDSDIPISPLQDFRIY